MAEDVTLFTDDTVQCDGPIRPGPSLYEWARTVDDDTLAALASPAVAEEIRSIGPMTFPTRLVQSVYLDWFHRRWRRCCRPTSRSSSTPGAPSI